MNNKIDFLFNRKTSKQQKEVVVFLENANIQEPAIVPSRNTLVLKNKTFINPI